MYLRLHILILLLLSSLTAQTMVSGNVNGLWDLQGSPYQLEDNTVVAVGDTLIITANTLVDLGGSFELRIRGTLIASNAQFFNGGELFGESGFLSLNACRFTGLNAGISVFGGQAAFENCIIDSTNETGITFSGTDTSYVRHSQVLTSGDYGIKITGTDVVEVVGNTLRGNSTHDFNHPALFIDSCSPQVIEQNIIEENHAQGIGVWTLTATAYPTIRNNIVRRNFTGITLVNSPAFIEGNIIVANYQERNADSGAGIYAGYPSSTGIVMNNYIAGNYYGVSNISSAHLNLGDMINDYPGDDGLNIFYDNTYNRQTWNIWNSTSDELLAQNNYWPGLTMAEVDATIWDNEEGGAEVIIEPVYVEALPVPPDVNADTHVNILDIVLVIENILIIGVPEPVAFFLSDVNRDYSVNVQDVVTLIERVLEG